MKNIVVIYGGRAVEHEVSVITGIQAIENLDKNKYNVIPVFIDKDGQMFTGECYKDFRCFKTNEFRDKKPVRFATNYGDHNLYIEKTGLFAKEEKIEIDCVLNGLHGSHGEDGAIQGIFETNGIPFTGPSLMSSSLGMDKIIMKDVFKANDIPVVKHMWFYRSDYEKHTSDIIQGLMAKLQFPMYVKPASLGSSIGIKEATDEISLRDAIAIAKEFDRKIIVEESVVDAVEFNVGVMGIKSDVEVSRVEVPEGVGEFYSFEKKYEAGSKSKITGGKHKFLEDEELAAEAQRLAKEAFICLDTRGNARIDILCNKDKELFVNEINTLPGSYGFYLWEDMGYTFKAVLDKMIDIAIKANEEEKETNYRFDADLFNKTSFGSKL